MALGQSFPVRLSSPNSLPPCHLPSDWILEPTPCGRSWFDAPMGRNSAPVSPTIPAASRAFCWTPRITISPASIRVTICPAWKRASKARWRRRESSAASMRRRSSASALTPPVRARSRSTARTGHSRWTGNGGRISPRSAGSGKTTPAGGRPPASLNLPRGIVRISSPSAATLTPPSGGGQKSGTAWPSPPRCSQPPGRGSNSPTGCPPSSPG